MSIEDARVHLEAARKALVMEAYRSRDPHLPIEQWEKLDHFTIAEELDRIDCALGPKGESIFAHLGDTVREAYTEIVAAQQALGGKR